MYVNSNPWQSLIVALGLFALIIGGLSFGYNQNNKEVEAKLTAQQSQFRSAILHERHQEVLSMLESAKSASAITALGDAVSARNSDASYSVVVDGDKETFMFYHSCGRDGHQPVAGIVVPRK